MHAPDSRDCFFLALVRDGLGPLGLLFLQATSGCILEWERPSGGKLCAAHGGVTRYVASNGDDSDPGTAARPFRTLNHGVRALSPGDTLCIRGGTYAERLGNVIPGGASWERPVTVTAFPGEAVVIAPSRGATRVLEIAGAKQAYIVVDGVTLDASNVQSDAVKITCGSCDTSGDAAHHIRIQNTEIKNAPGRGIYISAGAEYNELINLDVHDNGSGLSFASRRNLIENSKFYRNAGLGIQQYCNDCPAQGEPSPDDNVIRNNLIHDNAGGGGDDGAGIALYSSESTLVYNNVIWNNHSGIFVRSRGAKIFNNTVYANTRDTSPTSCIDIRPVGDRTLVKNNICWQNGGDITNDGTNTELSDNLTSDPKFVAPASFDFHLEPDSPAVDAGATLTEVPTDFDGVPRPQGSMYDIGAFER